MPEQAPEQNTNAREGWPPNLRDLDKLVKSGRTPEGVIWAIRRAHQAGMNEMINGGLTPETSAKIDELLRGSHDY